MTKNAKNNDPIVWVEGDAPEFVAAGRQAQATFVRDFAEPLARAEAENGFARVEAAIVKIFFPDPSDPGRGEHLWVNFHRWTGKLIVGQVTGEPTLSGFVPDQRVRVRLDRLSDWVMVVGGDASGGFTLPLILAGLPEAEATAFRTQPPFSWFRL